MDGFDFSTGRIFEAYNMNKTAYRLSGVVMIASIIGMITSTYTAYHIQKSTCDRSKDSRLESAYTWSWCTAVLCALIMVGTVGGWGYTTFKK